MRIRELFVASLLTMTFGCPGDDTGDTDANTTVNATDNTTPGTTTDTTTGDPPTTNTTTEDPTTTGEPPAEDSTTTGEPPAEDSTTAGAETTTGGVVNEGCETFCTTYFTNCGDDPANDYGDEATCATACADFDQKTFDCKEYHAGMAAKDPIHCSHSNLDGGGVCPAS